MFTKAQLAYQNVTLLAQPPQHPIYFAYLFLMATKYNILYQV